jgi:hypothetical protein
MLWLAIAGFALAFGFAAYSFQHPMDFRVYHYGARGVFDGSRPVYGRGSGLGWPMHYRYPPLFLLLFAPFAAIPLGWGAALWTFLKCVTLAFLVRYIWARAGPTSNREAWVIPLLLASPYVVEELRYGNAQFFVFALCVVAFISLRNRPVWAAGALGLAISLKVWPLYFVPYLGARREWKVAAWTLAVVAILMLIPSFYFGPVGNLRLLNQWAHQELTTQTGESEVWFPSQSLRGVLMRYLTPIDYSVVPDSNYPLVNFASLAPNLVRNASLALAGIGYCALLAAVRRCANMKTSAQNWLMWDALAFAALPLIQPFTQKYALVVLLFPAMIAGRVVGRGGQASKGATARWLLYSAIAFALAQPFIPGSPEQRLMQALGFDFVTATLLVLFLWANRRFSALKN